MMQRCSARNHPQAKDYIGRGIVVCKRWLTFTHFLADMGECPPELTLDRIDNDRGYEPGNCRWAGRLAQSQNRRRKGPQKLEAEQVIAIRADPRTYREIGAQYGVAPQQVEKIKNRKQWAHLP